MIPLIQMAGSSPAMTARTNVITGLDPVISSALNEMVVSSTAMTVLWCPTMSNLFRRLIASD